MLCYFPFIVGFILSRFCSCHVLPYFIKGNQRPSHHIHSLRSRCSTKKDAGNLVIVMKFMFQSIFGNSRQNSRHTSAQGREESLELHSILWSDWQTSKLKVLHHGNCFAAHVRRRYYFFGGREARTGNTSAVRRLICQGQEKIVEGYKGMFLILCMHFFNAYQARVT